MTSQHVPAGEIDPVLAILVVLGLLFALGITWAVFWPPRLRLDEDREDACGP